MEDDAEVLDLVASCASQVNDDDKTEKKAKLNSGDKGGTLVGFQEESASSSANARDLKDGMLVLSIVSKVHMPMMELWSMCKGLDAVVPRRVCINLNTPKELVPRLLQQDKRKVNKEHYFPVVNVCLGRKRRGVQTGGVIRYGMVSDDEVAEEAKDPSVARALTMMPPTLELLEFGDYYNLPLNMKHLTVDKVAFGNSYNSKVVLPLSAREVDFLYEFDQPLELHSGLESLCICSDSFNQSLRLPPSLKVLQFINPRNAYNYPLSLPASIKELTLGSDFNHPLELPDGVEIVRLSRRFSHPTVFPSSVRKLALGDDYNHPLELPSGLEELKLGGSFNQHLSLPSGLKVLAFTYSHPMCGPGIFWPGVSGGSVFNRPLYLPRGIREVTLGRAYNHPLVLPAGLERLFFTNDSVFNQPIITPPSLRKLHLGRNFNGQLELAAGLEELCFDESSAFDQPLVIPPNVHELILGDAFNQPLVLPAGLKTLYFSEDSEFDHPIDLPASLIEVKFGERFSQRVTVPEGLMRALFGPEYGQQVELP